MSRTVCWLADLLLENQFKPLGSTLDTGLHPEKVAPFSLGVKDKSNDIRDACSTADITDCHRQLLTGLNASVCIQAINSGLGWMGWNGMDLC